VYIRKAVIENFRALQHVEVPLNQFSVLVGENDVGKTSFLLALERFFAGKKISVVDDYFNRDIKQAICITLTFDDVPADEDLTPLKHTDGSVVIRRRFVFDTAPEVTYLGEDGAEVKIGKELLKQYFSEDSFHFVPVRRDLKVQFSMAQTALLGKTLRVKMQEAIEEQDDGSLPKVEKMLKDSLQEPERQLESFLRQQMHNDELQLDFADLKVDPVEGVTFSVKLSDDKMDDILIENRGAGTQNNLIIALFRLVASLHTGGRIIFAMEEPENSLHPKAQRQLLAVLQGISAESQVIVTTHSPVFIERSKFENNIILTRTAAGNTVAKVFNAELLSELRTDLGIRPSDTLLKGGGNCALIVEGNTEEEGFPIFMEMLGISEFKLGIAIVSLRGSDLDRVRNTARLLLAYDIPCVVVLDKDAKQVAEDIDRESRAGLPNIRKVFCLSLGAIEDYYPLDIVAEVINRELQPAEHVTAVDFDASKHGRERMDDFKRVMNEKGAGSATGYLKRYIGSTGTRMMKDRGMQVPDEIREIFETVQKIVEEQ
jgi:putative ATP-dependent endonuclease of OLD family